MIRKYILSIVLLLQLLSVFSQSNVISIFHGITHTKSIVSVPSDYVSDQVRLSNQTGLSYTKMYKDWGGVEIGFVLKKYSNLLHLKDIKFTSDFPPPIHEQITTYQIPIRFIFKTPKNILPNIRIYGGLGSRFLFTKEEGLVSGYGKRLTNGGFLMHVTEVHSKNTVLFEAFAGTEHKLHKRVVLFSYFSYLHGIKPFITEMIGTYINRTSGKTNLISNGNFFSYGLGLSYVF